MHVADNIFKKTVRFFGTYAKSHACPEWSWRRDFDINHLRVKTPPKQFKLSRSRNCRVDSFRIPGNSSPTPLKAGMCQNPSWTLHFFTLRASPLGTLHSIIVKWWPNGRITLLHQHFGGFLLAYQCKNSTGEEKITTHKKTPLLPAGRLSEKSQRLTFQNPWFFFDASRRFNSWFQVRSSLHSPCPKQNQARRTIVNTLAAGKVQAPKVRWLKPEAVDLQVHFKSHPAVQVSSSIDFKMTWISEDPWGCLGKCSLIFDRLLGKNHVGE